MDVSTIEKRTERPDPRIERLLLLILEAGRARAQAVKTGFDTLQDLKYNSAVP